MSSREIRNLPAELAQYQQRVIVASLVVVLMLALLGLRAFWLQVWRGSDLRAQAENNSVTWVPTVPLRGNILDRQGTVLASNYSAYTLEITPGETPDLKATLETLGALISINEREKRRFLQRVRDARRFESITLKTMLTDAEIAKLAAHNYRLPGVHVQARLFRRYPLGTTASHALGYIAKINAREKMAMQDWSDADKANYRGTQYIGKLGIEQQYEQLLHGRSGFERVETASNGRPLRTLDATAAVAGPDITLNLDIGLQQSIEQAYGDRRGAAVVMNPHTGEVLALVSMPTFDPNLFVEGIDQVTWDELNLSPDRPLFNRVLRGTYPPGSTYKPFMGLLALASGKRTADTRINDPGYWMLGNHRFRSHGDHGLGPVDLHNSIVHSSNVYYYTLAFELGVDAIHDFMKPLGFGQLTGIDLPNEGTGLLPNRAWKSKAFRNPQQQQWFEGETVSLGIGQGYNNFTMLQLATATSAIANGGYRVTPRVLKSVQGQATVQPEPMALGLNADHLQKVRDAMADVARRGTSADVFAGAPYTSAGKTGTAQAVGVRQNQRYNAARLAESQRDHSLYVAFAPVENPQVVVAVIVENAGFGAAHAAPIARKVFDYWLTRAGQPNHKGR